MFFAGIVMLAKNPNLLRKRLKAKEKEGEQKAVVALSGHPMYMSTVIMFLSMPLVLGSPTSFIIMLGYIPVIAKRIRNEEDVLTTGLDGYKEYKTRVKYKVIPFIW